LADAGVLHPRNRHDDWSITSGPYYVESFAPEAVHLKANPYFQPVPEIKDVIIHPRREPYLSQPFDVLKRPPYSLRPEVQEMVQKAERVWSGMPTTIYYFRFGKKHPLRQDERLRQAFATVVHHAFHDASVEGVNLYHRQMLPKGYTGYLTTETEPPLVLSGKIPSLTEPLRVTLNVAVYHEWAQLLENSARRLGLALQVLVTDSKDEEAFALQEAVVGDQRDPRATWNFLLEGEGALSGFREELAPWLTQKEKDTFEGLHQEVLQRAIAVPFLAEYDAFLTSQRVNLEKINPFDQRPRFYQMSWSSWL
jgi:hypothetical protein